MSATSLSTLLMLFHTLVTMLVVDPAQFLIAEDFIRLRNFYEFLLRRVIVGVLVGVVLLREGAIGFLDLSFASIFVEAK